MGKLVEIINALENTQEEDAALLQELLRVGCDFYSVLFGIISFIKEDKYIIHQAEAPLVVLEQGDPFIYKESYCDFVVNTKKTQYFRSSGRGNLNVHPCYRGFGLETFIGTPLMNGDKVAGMLDFSSPAERFGSFTEEDVKLVERAARAVEKILFKE